MVGAMGNNNLFLYAKAIKQKTHKKSDIEMLIPNITLD